MNQTIHIKASQDFEEEISTKDLNFHPVLKDIEHIFLLFLLSAKALSLFETQNILSSDINFSQILKKYNALTGLEIKKDPNSPIHTTKLNILKEMIFLGKAMAILMYDFILASKYNSILNKESDIQFLKYIRNGAAHNNKFNMKDEQGAWKVDEGETIEWHNKKIDKDLHGKKVFPNFVSIIDMILLANEISKKLTRIDKKQ